MGVWWPEVEVNKEHPEKLKAGESKGIEGTVESELPQGRGESLLAQLDSAVNQAEQLRDQQVQQQPAKKRTLNGSSRWRAKNQDRADRAALGQGRGD